MSRRVTAGIDGSEESRAAADWAAAEALRRRTGLRLVHGWGVASPLEPMGAPEVDQQASEQVLREARDRLLAGHPGLDVTTESVAGGPAAALLDASRESDVVVLGSRGLGTVAGFLLGSVSMQTVAWADCPVVVVRAGTERRAPEQPAPEVVLGLKRLEEPDGEVLDFAFAEAAARGLPLRAVHARSDPAPVASQVAGALQPWRDRYPGQEVDETVMTGQASEVLLDATPGAELVVVGRGGRHGGLGSRVGPVGHALLHHAACPVAVVPHG
ncbi:universal stress protein [Streptomyces aidingensis]|uniref:Nucleotide-binding universal stress protein, UspA family n=1 Tax=Streptomyces aidingensis TaxID=910347 RepID=A0A1I1H231_9ACTN|nr:universal stress protein [Streptomyces aidingensis]SFC18097.1 Nucleotide-binding universal stress protein, UspA family [Streptomyces aidingensis]